MSNKVFIAVARYSSYENWGKPGPVFSSYDKAAAWIMREKPDWYHSAQIVECDIDPVGGENTPRDKPNE